LDCLHIDGLKVNTRIGVYAWEQQICQPLLIDISIPADFKVCDDQLAKTIDYDKLCQRVTDYVESNAFQLIETVAHQIVQLIKREFNVKELSVAVSKPHAVKNALNIKVSVTG
jgi:dihydroneopterin aldolase